MPSLARGALALASTLAAAALAWQMTRVAPYAPVTRTRRLVVPSTWPALQILHLSDLHLRRGDQRLFDAQRRVLSRQTRQPDLVCITGDLCERAADAPLVVDLLSGLTPRLGTYLIPGNHEYGASSPRRANAPKSKVARLVQLVYRNALSAGPPEADAIVDALRAAGLQVLRNQGVRLEADGRSVWLAGVDDGWAGRADVAQALGGRRAGEATLALIHEPELAFAAVDEGADVVLAGHTHGGQVSFPIIGPPYWHRLDSRLHTPSGVQAIGNKAQLHISAGLGQLFPLRFRCPPELVWLQCVPEEVVARRAER